VTAHVAERGSARQRSGEIGRAAVIIGALTMLARVIGFGRQVVFAHTVQASCLGTAYTTANMVPNIIYDIVMGGALTAVVVPVLAGPARAGAIDRGQVRQTSGALLSWTVLLLVPVSAVVAIAARPLVSLLLGATPGCPRSSMVTLGTRMLVIFAPQILLYGLAVVLYGILQAHRKFVAPALAPVLSSLVVIGAYFWFGVVGDGYQDILRPVPAVAWVILAVGTTAGVAALVATPLIPVARLYFVGRTTPPGPPANRWTHPPRSAVGATYRPGPSAGQAARPPVPSRRSLGGTHPPGPPFAEAAGHTVSPWTPRRGLRLPPVLRFPAGVGARARSLAVAGIATLIAQDASVAVVIVLANSRGGSGALVLYSFAWAVFFVPYAVLAVPIATSAFPELSLRSDRFDATSATSTRAVTVASWLGVAGMAGTCLPLAKVFQSHPSQAADARQLAVALAAFAPGLVGYGLTANLSRVLYADGRSRASAAAVSGGWVLVIVADLLIVPFVPRSQVVGWLGAGTTIGLTGAGLLLLVLARRFRGPDALHGCARAALAGLAGALAGMAAGLGVAAAVPVSGFLPNVAVTLLSGAAVLAAFLAVVAVADGGDLRALLRRMIRA
jgi:putative peptidoglycan lipid II flippase